ncbi:MAG: winged helix-turn-helix domain-containing protein [Woeseiaceae bacterium]|nr:winged helix-turn-helix domain-containing protein [Woeseiaceae bacterium]
MPTEDELRQGFTLGEWEVLPLRGVLRRGDEEERPEPRVFGVLIALAKRDGDLVTRDELVDELWDGRPTSDEPINRCLSQLRGHLGDKSRPHEYVETLTRRGYRLMKPVELMHPAEPEATLTPDSPVAPARWKAITAAIIVGFVAWVVWTQIPPADFKSIGVMPFENASLDSANDYLVSGFKDELVQTLHNIPNFTVKSSRVARQGDEATEMARDLGVDAVLTGRVHRNGDALQIFYTVEDGHTGSVIATGDLDGPVDEIFRLQEDLAKMVRDDLFGRSSQQLITRTRPASFGAYDRYMRGLYAFDKRQDSSSSLEEAIELFQDTIRLDENFGPAYVMLATAYALLPTYRDAPIAELNELAIDTVERGVNVDDSIRDATKAVYGFVNHREKNWLQAEQAYLEATSADIVDPNAFNWYSRMLASVGRLDASLEQALAGLEMDPTSAVLNSRVAAVYLWLGDTAKAEEFYARSEKYGATGATHLMGYSLILVRQGRYDEASALLLKAFEVDGASPDWIEPVFAALSGSSPPSAGLAIVDEAAAQGQMPEQGEFIVRMLLGDLEGAMSVARLLEKPGEVFEMDLLFIPETKPLRDHPEFMDLMRSLGISEYWYERGCTLIEAGVDCDPA